MGGTMGKFKTKITSVSTSLTDLNTRRYGSTEGGTELFITGTGFIEMMGYINIYINGKVCEVTA
jgi:hypothetical protein